MAWRSCGGVSFRVEYSKGGFNAQRRRCPHPCARLQAVSLSPSRCGAAPCPCVMSSAISQVVRGASTPRPARPVHQCRTKRLRTNPVAPCPAAQADVLRQQIEAGQHFRKDVEAYWQACEQWADAELDSAEASSQEVAKKKAERSFPRRDRRGDRRTHRPSVADALDFEAIETAARRQALAVAARAVEQRFKRRHLGLLWPRLPCSCGQSARYAGRREKTFISVLGSVTFKRAYYHCEACRAGLCPRDRALGLEDGSLSPGVLRMVGQVGARVSFEEGHELLHELASVQLPTKHVERAAEALGREIAADERSSSSYRQPTRPPHRRCTWAWTAPVCRCARRRSRGRAGKQLTAPLKHAGSSS